MTRIRALPDASRLASIPESAWRALPGRLREIGLTKNRAAEISDVGATAREFHRAPMRRWRLRRRDDRAAWAMRLLMFQDSVAPGEAEEALGPDIFRSFADAGFVVETAGGGLVSPFLLNFVGDLLVVCDDLTAGGDAVMGASEITADLCNATFPIREIETALDVGCGAGTAALILARRARRVVGTDINPRAILLSRVNAAINGIANAEFVEGDLLAPVAGRNFDWIVSQPPFVARYDGAQRTAYLDGGTRGDEIPLKLLREAPAHLDPGGRAFVLSEWPIIDETPLEQRVRAVVPDDGVSVLVLEGPGRSLDGYCTAYAARQYPDDPEAFAREAIRRRDHLEREGIRDLCLGLVVLERRASGPGWTFTLPIRAFGRVRLTGGRLNRLIAARDLAGASDEELMTAALRAPEGTTFVEERDTPGVERPDRILARFDEDALIEPVGLNAATYALLSVVHSAPDVRAAVERLAEVWQADPGSAAKKVLPALRDALLRGVLEVFDHGTDDRR